MARPLGCMCNTPIDQTVGCMLHTPASVSSRGYQRRAQHQQQASLPLLLCRWES